MNETESTECGITTNTNDLKENVPLTDITETKLKEIRDGGILVTQFKNYQNKTGIYKILNLVNNKYYIGSAKNLYVRFHGHLSKLHKNIHDNEHLQRSWNKYGEDNFKFYILEETKSEEYRIIEQKYLDIIKNDRPNCYNMKFVVEGSDSICMCSPKTRLKISNSKKGTIPYNKGIPMTNKQKKLISKIRLYKYGILIDIYKNTGEFIETKLGIKSVIKKYNISEGMLFGILNGKRYSGKGYVFRRSKIPYTQNEIEHIKTINNQRNGISIDVYDTNKNFIETIKSKKKIILKYKVGQDTLNKILNDTISHQNFIFKYHQY